MNEHSRIADLRRRIQEDPASLVFAELAEEYRRSGNNAEAVSICRAGLVHHPDNLTARLTLGRALIELNKLDEAFGELTCVLDASPGNLPAIRALAEIYQHRGMMSEALVHYRRALQLAQHDAELSEHVDRIEQATTPRAAPVDNPPSPAVIEELFNFDSLLAQLDATRDVLAAPTFVPLRLAVATPLDTAIPPGDDSFAEMERKLREREEQRLIEERQARVAEAERRRVAVLQELEGWLAAIAQDRRSYPSA